jgi:lipopolysaccharide export system permease protein
MKVLDRYVLTEFAQVITVATLAILGVFFGTVEFQHVLQVMAKLGVPGDTLFLVDMLQLPLSIVYCLPAAVVCAAAVVWIRQQQSNEILALQMCGVSKRRIFAPFIAIGLVAGLVGFWIGDTLAPNSRYLSQKLLLARINNSERPFPGRGDIRLGDEQKLHQWLIFGDTVGNATQPFVAFDFSSPQGPLVMYSHSANWKKGVWQLSDGVLCELPWGNGKGLHYKFGNMEVGGLKPIARAIETAPKSMFDQTIAEMRADIEKKMRAGIRIEPETFIQLYRRYSQPLSCVLLLLAAAPLTLFRNSKFSAQTQYVYVGVLVASFFLLQDLTYALGENARIEPWMAAFLPSLALSCAGLGYIWLREQRQT